MERRDYVREQIAGEAAEWFARLHETPRADAMEEGEFAQWMLRSPAHVEEYLAVTRLWGDVAGLEDADLEKLIREAREDDEAPNVVALAMAAPVAAPVVSQKIPARRPHRRYAYAASILVVLAAAGWLLDSMDKQPSELITAIGEQRSFALADGSMVHLNTDSRLRLAVTDRERRLVLERGEGRFTVAKDPLRPFLVTTPQAIIRAVGTQFNVQVLGDRTAVTVIEGRVAVTGSGAAPLELTAGEQASVTQDGDTLAGRGPGVERALAWTQRRLIFHEEPLSAVVAEFNRYHAQPMRIEDPALASMKISGAFDAGDPQSLVEYLERYERVGARKAADGSTLLERE